MTSLHLCTSAGRWFLHNSLNLKTHSQHRAAIMAFILRSFLFHGWNVLSPKNVTFVSSECQGMPSMPVQSLPGIFSSLLLAFWPNNWQTGSVFWVSTWLGSFSGASNCTEDGPPLGLPLVFAPVSPLFYQMAVKGLVCPSQPCLFS